MTPERKERIQKVLNNRQPDLTVVLENVHDPHNIAAVMRSCDAVGVQEIYILNTSVKLPYRFKSKAAASAGGWLTIHRFENTAACFEAVRKKYSRVYATHLSEKACSLYALNLAMPSALVFGNEHSGVSEEALQFCDDNFIIPQVGMVKSLNISVACAVSLYEAFRQRSAAGYYDGSVRLSKNEQDALQESWGLNEE